jgi:soluble lytic murein transglycosylase-like protein
VLPMVLLTLVMSTSLEKQIYRFCKPEFNHQLAMTKAKHYAPLIEKASCKYKLPSHVVASMVWHESNYKPNMVSPYGARGLMQVMPMWFKRGENWRDHQTNIMVGCRVLTMYRKQFHGDMHRALTAYCYGPRPVTRGKYRSRYSNQVLKRAW